MKRVFTMILICCMMSLMVGCGDSKVIDGKNYKQIGFFELGDMSSNVQYDFIWGNFIWCILSSWTVVAPFVLNGWYAYEPVGKNIEFKNQINKLTN